MVGGVKIPGKDGMVGVVGMVVGKGKNGIPDEGDEPNGGNVVGNAGVWSVGTGKLPPKLGRPGMFKRRRAAVAFMLLERVRATRKHVMTSLVEAILFVLLV